jgi:hypothetical protein
VLLAIAAPFIHKLYSKTKNIYSQEYLQHKAKYSPIINKRDLTLNQLIRDLESKNISVDNYIKSYRETINLSKSELKAYTLKKNELKNSYKFFGFNSKRLFLQNLGVIVLSLIVSLFFLNIVFNPITEKFKKIIFTLIAGSFVFVSLYLLAWVLFAQRVFNGDFPELWYQLILWITPIFVTILSILLFRHYRSIELWYKSIVNKLIVFIINSDKYIDSKEKENKHFLDSMDVFEKIVK